MAKQQPKKRQPTSRQLKLTITQRDKWKQILKEVEKEQAPLSVLRGITVNLIDGSQVDLDIQALLEQGLDPESLEQEINDKLKSLDDLIEDVDFFISLDHVAQVVQPFTDKLLKDL
jgi:hypothetical protein